MEFLMAGALKAASMYTESKNKVEIVNKLLTLEKEQAKLFDMFEQELKAIQQGPFYVGLTYLEEANEPHRSKKDSLKMQKDALSEFMKVYGVQRAKIMIDTFMARQRVLAYQSRHVIAEWLLPDQFLLANVTQTPH